MKLKTLKNNKRVIEKEYKEEGIKVTRYAPVQRKPVTMPRCNRKPTYGPKAP